MSSTRDVESKSKKKNKYKEGICEVFLHWKEMEKK